jgi:hypothetical protein
MLLTTTDNTVAIPCVCCPHLLHVGDVVVTLVAAAKASAVKRFGSWNQVQVHLRQLRAETRARYEKKLAAANDEQEKANIKKPKALRRWTNIIGTEQSKRAGV